MLGGVRGGRRKSGGERRGVEGSRNGRFQVEVVKPLVALK